MRLRALAIAGLAALASGCAATRPVPAPDLAAPAAPDAAAAPGARAPEASMDGGADATVAPVVTSAPAPEGAADAEVADAPRDPALERLREQVLDAARARVGARTRLDCSGYVLAALRAAGLTPRLAPARSRSESLYRASRPVERPRPGDLVFFHDTYDRDRNGRAGDRFTHVGLVEAVDGDAVTILHRGGRVERIRMDLSRPSDPAANDPVRMARRRDARGTRYLAGELFAAYGELLGGDVTQMLQGGRASVVRARHPATR
ncbi:NlpC/P60 family protein [Anaeromyxobacter sp. Red801]|uniref:NlpC/P60 family protein n=1 Tax=Anaeromyxobacter sp. Red801 TaxID=3411632 RepID=UPI003B9DF831